MPLTLTVTRILSPAIAKPAEGSITSYAPITETHGHSEWFPNRTREYWKEAAHTARSSRHGARTAPALSRLETVIGDDSQVFVRNLVASIPLQPVTVWEVALSNARFTRETLYRMAGISKSQVDKFTVANFPEMKPVELLFYVST